MIETLHKQQPTGRRGMTATCTDTASLCIATLAEVYRMPMRSSAGLKRWLLLLLGLKLSVPCYTTLCRRRRSLEVELPRLRKSEPLHLVVDSTGIKVYGECKWKER